MPRAPAILLVLLSAALAGGCSRSPRAHSPSVSAAGGAAATQMRGAWRVVELAERAPGGEWVVRGHPAQSLYVFTDRHHSYMYVRGDGPRPRFAGDGNRPTDAERVIAYNTIIAGAGTYTVVGDTLIAGTELRKNPNEMGGPPWRYHLAWSADTVRMTIADPPFLPGREWRTLLVRIE